MLTNETIAQVCWGSSRELLRHWGKDFGAWDDLLPEARQALTGAARHLRLGASVEESHRQWCKILTEAGWRLDEDRDKEEYCHPWLCGWRSLDEGARLFFKMQRHIVVFLVLEYPEGSDFAQGLMPRRLPAT
jgi:hypothetical protein